MSALSVADLTVRLGSTLAVDRATFSADPGTLVAIVGPNGAGKTSLVRAIAGLVRHSGQCSLAGKRLEDLGPAERARRIAYQPQRADFAWALPVRDAVALGRLPHGDPFGRASQGDAAAVATALDRLSLTGLSDRPVTSLSGGERARVMLARVLATGAQAILADEPTAALDPAHQILVLDLLREEARAGRLVLAVLHDLALAARFADRVLVIDQGVILADGTADEVLTDDIIARVFGLRCLFVEIDGRRVPVPAGRL
jgi:iron complex transport system ATP-binding protein